MAGRYTGSYLDKLNDWRVVAILADLGRASLVIRIPTTSSITLRMIMEPAATRGSLAGLDHLIREYVG
jgi:hypothetical protein